MELRSPWGCMCVPRISQINSLLWILAPKFKWDTGNATYLLGEAKKLNQHQRGICLKNEWREEKRNEKNSESNVDGCRINVLFWWFKCVRFLFGRQFDSNKYIKVGVARLDLKRKFSKEFVQGPSRIQSHKILYISNRVFLLSCMVHIGNF